VDAREPPRVQPLLELAHGHPQDVGLAVAVCLGIAPGQRTAHRGQRRAQAVVLDGLEQVVDRARLTRP
jgi:hypothetical protein